MDLTTSVRHMASRRASMRVLVAGALACTLAGSLMPAVAQTAPPVPPAPASNGATATIAWRQTSVFAERQGMGQLRRGVALFANGEPALLQIRLQPTGRPVDGRMTVLNEMRFRFDDGSGFTLRGAATVPVNADGSPVLGENTLSGDIADGTGRFAGIAGTYRMRTRTDMTATVDGVLGDYFGAGTASYTLGR